jgi:hypothetical protein
MNEYFAANKESRGWAGVCCGLWIHLTFSFVQVKLNVRQKTGWSRSFK